MKGIRCLFFGLLAFALAAVQAGPAATALPTVDPPVRLFSAAYVPPSLNRVAAIPGRAYVTAGHALLTLDTTDPDMPVWLGETFFPQPVTDIEVYGQYAYVATLSQVVHILDLDTPGRPEFRGVYTAPEPVATLAIDGDRLFLLGATALTIAGLSDPLHPQQIGSLANDFGATVLTAASGKVFLASSGYYFDPTFFRVFDVSVPANPQALSEVHVSAAVSIDDLALQGDLLAVTVRIPYIYGETPGLNLYSLADPQQPVLLGWHRPYLDTSYAVSVELQGDFAYLAYGAFLEVISVTEPQTPTLAAQSSGIVYQFSLAGQFAYATARSRGFHIIDLSDPLHPLGRGALPGMGRADHALFKDGRVYLADQGTRASFWTLWTGGGVVAVELDSPLSGGPAAAITGQAYRPGTIRLAADDTYAYALYRNCDYPKTIICYRGFSTLSLAAPGEPVFAGYLSLDTPETEYDDSIPPPFQVAVADGLAYVADGQLGLHIISLTQPLTPTLAGHFPAPELEGVQTYIQGAAAQGPYAFVSLDAPEGSGRPDELAVLDVSQPASPTLVTSYPYDGELSTLTLHDQTLYVAAGSAGVHILDVSAPPQAPLLATYDTPGTAHEVAAAGPYAYVADGYEGLHLLDVTDPANPLWLDTASVPGAALGVAAGVAAGREWAAVSAGAEGLFLFKTFTVQHRLFFPFAGHHWETE